MCRVSCSTCPRNSGDTAVKNPSTANPAKPPTAARTNVGRTSSGHPDPLHLPPHRPRTARHGLGHTARPTAATATSATWTT